MGKCLAVLHVLKKYVEGNDHLNGEMAVMNTHTETVLDDALRMHTKMSGNYTVLSIIVHEYERNDATVWTDRPTREVCRWNLPTTGDVFTPADMRLLDEAMDHLEAQFRDLADHPNVKHKYDAIMDLYRKVRRQL